MSFILNHLRRKISGSLAKGQSKAVHLIRQPRLSQWNVSWVLVYRHWALTLTLSSARWNFQFIYILTLRWRLANPARGNSVSCLWVRFYSAGSENCCDTLKAWRHPCECLHHFCLIRGITHVNISESSDLSFFINWAQFSWMYCRKVLTVPAWIYSLPIFCTYKQVISEGHLNLSLKKKLQWWEITFCSLQMSHDAWFFKNWIMTKNI